MSTRPPQAPRPRTGISLLEVLISMFILLFGLMGVAAMFPAGAHHAGRARQFDTAAAVGLAAYEDLRIRGLIRRLGEDRDGNPGDDNWLRADGSEIGPSASSVVVWPVVCDPARGINGQPSPVWQTARPTNNANEPPRFPQLLPKNLVLPGASGAPALLGVPTYAMQSRHDLALELPDDGDLPARDIEAQLLQPPTIGQTSGYRQFSGEYSWIFTVAPAAGTAMNGLQADHVTVSVAVFRRRNIESEWTAEQISIAGGYGGGEATIADSSGISERLENIRGGDWVLVTDPVNSTLDPQASNPAPFVKWCRVAATDEIDTTTNPGQPARIVTLTGTDWNPDWDRANVTLFDRVVAVYERVVRLESRSPWSYW